MAQPKFDTTTILLSQIIGDEVTTSSTDGNLFTATERMNLINRARGAVYARILMLGDEKVVSIFPEFNGFNAAMPIVSNVITKTAEIRKCWKLYWNGKLILPVPAQMTINAYHDSYSGFLGESGRLKFIESAGEIKIIGVEIPEEQDAEVSYLKQPVDIAGIGGVNADMTEPYMLLKSIAEEAAILAFQTKQKMMPVSN